MEARPGVILVALVLGALGLLSVATLAIGLLAAPGGLAGWLVDLVLAILLIVAAVGLLREEKWGLVLALLLLVLRIAGDALRFSLDLTFLAILALEVLALVYLIAIRDEFL
jgi:hypothetical protein